MSICAIVVSYNPDLDIIKNLNALFDQVDEVVIVDNGSGVSGKKLLVEIYSNPKAVVIYNEENLGIAEALNIGVKHAKASGYYWVATFDQDSRVMPGMIATMLTAYYAYPEREKVAMLAPRYKSKESGLITRSASENVNYSKESIRELKLAITSGNLVKLSIFDSVGYFNEALFIDYVDFDFCLRCGNYDYKILQVYDAVLEHSVGSPSQHRFFGKIKTTTNHSALRRYYIARNRIYLYKKFGTTSPFWVSTDSYVFLMEVVKIIFFERGRRKKLSALFMGIFHGIIGRMGKL